MTLGFNFIGSRLGTCGAQVVSPISNLSGGLDKPFLNLVKSPNSQAVINSPQAVSTNSQGKSAVNPQVPQTSRQAARARANNLLGSPRDSSLEGPNPKWFINLSGKPLTQAQRSVLAKGPNFAVSSRNPPNLEYITAIESVCTKLGQQDAEEPRAEINRVLRSSHPPNLT